MLRDAIKDGPRIALSPQYLLKRGVLTSPMKQGIRTTGTNLFEREDVLRLSVGSVSKRELVFPNAEMFLALSLVAVTGKVVRCTICPTPQAGCSLFLFSSRKAACFKE